MNSDEKAIVPKTLHELVTLSQDIKRALIDGFGELTEDAQKALELLDSRLPDKADGYKFVTDDLRNEAALWKKRAQDFLTVARTFETHADNMEQRLADACIQMEVKELVGRDYRWQLQNAKPKVIIDDETKIPSGHKEIVQVIKIRKDGILEDLKQGVPVPGTHLEESLYVRCYMNNKKGVENVQSSNNKGNKKSKPVIASNT